MKDRCKDVSIRWIEIWFTNEKKLNRGGKTMKEKTVLRTILSLTLAAFLLSGCGNSKETPAEEVPTVAAEEVTEELEKEEEQEAQQPAEEETPTEEEVAEELEYNYDNSSIEEYMKTLDPKKPVIIIYNEKEGYKIKLKEDQEYFLKQNDRIFLNNNSREVYSISQDIPTSSDLINYGMDATEVIPDYSKFSDSQQVYFGIKLKENPEADMIWFGCKLIPPAE